MENNTRRNNRGLNMSHMKNKMIDKMNNTKKIYYKVVAGIEWVRWSHSRDWIIHKPGMCELAYLSDLKRAAKQFNWNAEFIQVTLEECQIEAIGQLNAELEAQRKHPTIFHPEQYGR